jgi:hypothetical protein
MHGVAAARGTWPQENRHDILHRVRLGSYVAIELAFGAALVAAAIGGGTIGIRELRRAVASEAFAATTPRPDPVVPVRMTRAGELAPVPAPMSLFEGVADDVLLSPLRESEVVRVKFNTGGASISLRLEFENGARAAFKPEQLNWQSMPRKEVAAYRIDRLLGLSAVAPAIGREFGAAELFDKLDPDFAWVLPRLKTEIVQRDGRVRGELSWWIPEIKYAVVGGFRVDSVEGIVTWKRYLAAGAPIPHREWSMAAQLSDMVVFDFLINNPDRWSGGNVRTDEDQRVLYFMDNTMAFAPMPAGSVKSRTYLSRVEKFSRAHIRALRGLDESRLRAALGEDTAPFEELLTAEEIDSLLSRRAFILAYVDGVLAAHGEANVLVFP